MYEKRLVEIEKSLLTPSLGDIFFNYYTHIYETWNGKKWVNLISEEMFKTPLKR